MIGIDRDIRGGMDALGRQSEEHKLAATRGLIESTASAAEWPRNSHPRFFALYRPASPRSQTMESSEDDA